LTKILKWTTTEGSPEGRAGYNIRPCVKWGKKWHESINLDEGGWGTKWRASACCFRALRLQIKNI